MDLAALRSRFRLDALDESAPYAFSDAWFLAKINDALAEACTRMDLVLELEDAAFCSIATAEATEHTDSIYDLNADVTRVRAASWLATGSDTDPYPVKLIDRAQLDQEVPNWRIAESAYPTHMVVEDTKVYLAPGIINEAGSLTLEVWRRAVALAADENEPEIAAVHHHKLLHWVLAEAFDRTDTEIYNPQKAQQERAKFDAYFGAPTTADQRRSTEEQPPAVVGWY